MTKGVIKRGSFRGPAGPGYAGTVSVRDYGARGDGATDDTTAIQSAINAAAAVGGTVWVPPGVYRTSAPLEVPENIELRAAQVGRIVYGGTASLPCSIRPLPGHSGPAVIRLRGKAETARTYEHVNAKIRNLQIDGSAGPSGLKGIALYGLVREAVLVDVTVYKTSDAGFWCGAGSASTTIMPQSLRLERCVGHQCGGAGFSFANVPDSVLVDCLSIGGSWVGFYLAGFVHGTLIGCKAEWNAQHGFYVTSGWWGTGTGSGGALLVGCSTDRNGYNGVYVDATGNAALIFVGLLLRRDGRNGGAGGGGYAGFFVATAATVPIRVTGVQVYPGVDDDGSQAAGPQIGLSSTGSSPSVTVTDGELHAITTALAAGAGCVVSPTVGLTTGTTDSPARTPPAALVAVTQRGPIGGVQAQTLAAGTYAIDATSPNVRRFALTGSVTLNVPTGGTDGQRITFWLGASGAARTATFAAGYETSPQVPTRTISIASGTWEMVEAECRNGAWRLIRADQLLFAPADIGAAAAGAPVFAGQCTTALSIASGYTAVPLNAETMDTADGHSTNSTTRYTAQVAGNYWAAGWAAYEVATGNFAVMIYKNGARYPGAITFLGALNPRRVSTPSKLIPLAVGDYLELYVYQDTGSAKALTVVSPEGVSATLDVSMVPN